MKRKGIPQKIRQEVMKRDNYTCRYCLKPLNTPGYISMAKGKIHIDHIIPLARGGIDDISNMQVLCDECNMHKNDRLEEELDQGKLFIQVGWGYKEITREEFKNGKLYFKGTSCFLRLPGTKILHKHYETVP